jgi:uncharacterized membrane protein YdjX (TVP38/TMEM64 family)
MYDIVDIPWVKLREELLLLQPHFFCALTFFLIRYMGGNALRKVNNKLLLAVLSRLDSHPLESVVLARMLFQTEPMLNYALALSGIKTRYYLLGHLLGLPLPIALYCLFFDYLAKAMHLISQQ